MKMLRLKNRYPKEYIYYLRPRKRKNSFYSVFAVVVIIFMNKYYQRLNSCVPVRTK